VVPEPARDAQPSHDWRAADAPGDLRRYLLAGLAYIALGLVVKQVLAWWTYGMFFLLLAVWGVPAWRERRHGRARR
jgi:hypothetical protein